MRSTTTPLADLLARSTVVDLDVWRGVRLAELALAGDVDAAMEWLGRFGGDQWSIDDMPGKRSYPT
jgi:hypothetical protein